MAIEKKILKNRPFVDAQGQYNFEDNVNIGVDKQGRVGVESDLYTTSENNIETEQTNFTEWASRGRSTF